MRPEGLSMAEGPGRRQPGGQEKAKEDEEIGADFVCTTIDAALEAAFIKAEPRKLAQSARPLARAASRRRKKAAD
ncbi:hypothetical protein ACJMQP_25835, partial [Rhodopseudomonas palustris]